MNQRPQCHGREKGGLVKLSGKANNAAEKDLTTELVSDVHGVKSVVNNMSKPRQDQILITNHLMKGLRTQ